MCTSNVASAIQDNPLVGISSDKPALVKVGGKGDSLVGIGTKGKGYVKVGGEGNSVIGVGGRGRAILGWTGQGPQFYGVERLFKKRGGGIGSPPDVTEPPKSRGRNQELAVETAKAAQKRRLALLGLKRFLLTGGRGVTSIPTLGKKALLGS